MVPTLGRIVLYRLTAEDAQQVTAHRTASTEYGNHVQAGDVYPAVIVRAFGDDPLSPCNLRVLLDGTDHYWATSRHIGDQPGHWTWPARA